MFDDKPISQPQNPKPNVVPPNLPTGEGFSLPLTSNQPSAPVNSSVGPNRGVNMAEPEDILAGIEKDQPNVVLPTKALRESRDSVPPAELPKEKVIAKEPMLKKYWKVIGLVGSVVIVVGILGGAGWFGYQYFGSRFMANPKQVIDNNLNNDLINNEPAVNQGVNINNEPAVNQNNSNTNQVPARPVDTDLDGITDEEETMYGTDINKVDTDNDGLTDRDEVKVFETDPNNPDTDGDTYKDGDEVRSGYDPKGSGKLLKI